MITYSLENLLLDAPNFDEVYCREDDLIGPVQRVRWMSNIFRLAILEELDFIHIANGEYTEHEHETRRLRRASMARDAGRYYPIDGKTAKIFRHLDHWKARKILFRWRARQPTPLEASPERKRREDASAESELQARVPSQVGIAESHAHHSAIVPSFILDARPDAEPLDDDRVAVRIQPDAYSNQVGEPSPSFPIPPVHEIPDGIFPEDEFRVSNHPNAERLETEPVDSLPVSPVLPAVSNVERSSVERRSHFPITASLIDRVAFPGYFEVEPSNIDAARRKSLLDLLNTKYQTPNTKNQAPKNRTAKRITEAALWIALGLLIAAAAWFTDLVTQPAAPHPPPNEHSPGPRRIDQPPIDTHPIDAPIDPGAAIQCSVLAGSAAPRNRPSPAAPQLGPSSAISETRNTKHAARTDRPPDSGSAASSHPP
jgi:hypothetical protein